MNARMRQMQKSLGGFRAALLIGWLALGAAGLIYARAKGIPTWAALPVLAAFLIEYLILSGSRVRKRARVAGFRNARTATGPDLGATALLPYLAYSLPTHQFHWLALVRLAALTFTVSLWYIVLPRVGLVRPAVSGTAGGGRSAEDFRPYLHAAAYRRCGSRYWANSP